MHTILDEISRELEILRAKKKNIFDLKRNNHRTRKYKRLMVMEKHLEDAYDNLHKYMKRSHIYH